MVHKETRKMHSGGRIGILLVFALLFFSTLSADPANRPLAGQAASLRMAIEDLVTSFGDRYPNGALYLKRLQKVKSDAKKLRALRREALLANPLLDFQKLLIVKRRPRQDLRPGFNIGLPTNHECNASLQKLGWDNEIAVLEKTKAGRRLRTIYRPEGGGYVGEIDLHPSAEKLLFTRSDGGSWKVCELSLREGGAAAPRQVSRMPSDVDAFDGCYVPGGRIVFCSTASFQSIPCWHGQRRVSSLYSMKHDGTEIRQLCFDQDHDLHPICLPNGQVLYNRWDYTGIIHIYLRTLMLMNPDGTGQRAIYGSNSWFPNSLYFTRPLPGESDRFVSILSGYHGPNRMGRLVLLDTTKGWSDTVGIVHEFPYRGRPLDVKIRDNLMLGTWPRFLHPWPLGDPSRPETSGKYFLVSCKMHHKASWSIYLVDTFDNMVEFYRGNGYALLEPVPLLPRPQPRAIPDRTDRDTDSATLFLHDIYHGDGLKGVPRGTVKKLRVFAYHFGYYHLAGPDKIGWGGPWEAMRIIGTVPVSPEGSAAFSVPAQTPVAVQALDGEGRAVQLMRSWMTLQAGEHMSCVGCHEPLGNTPHFAGPDLENIEPVALTPWGGPARGFDFEREVQPVLDAYCVRCHNGGENDEIDLRREALQPGYRGQQVSKLGRDRMHPTMKASTGGRIKYTPAYDALVPYLRRVGIEDDASLLTPGEYCVDTSPLVKLIAKGHYGVQLNEEAWDRLVTWIDLNAPCHGTWHEVHPFPTDSHKRRMALRKRYGGPAVDPEIVPEVPAPVFPEADRVPAANEAEPKEARRRQDAEKGSTEKSIACEGMTIKLVRIPAGAFAMGGVGGGADERPRFVARCGKAFWMSRCEITNAQFRTFKPDHTSGYYTKRHAAFDDKGLTLDGPDQPAVRVSWEEAVSFCAWLTEKTGRQFMLPTEVQWEYACRAGSEEQFWFGEIGAESGAKENLGDVQFSRGLLKEGKQITGGVEHLVIEGAALATTLFDDGFVVTAPVGSKAPNSWGLYDMHGNAAEWTLSDYEPYPLGVHKTEPKKNNERKVVRGGSFFSPPRWAGSSYRWAYPPWRKVVTVGFRVVCPVGEPDS